ncbi:MAG: hypothetical protein U5L11_07235 [Arhodomonas sp.]|nr:hypothetical protein [Arhodomonas sp.]
MKNDALQREQLAPWLDAVRAIPNPVQSAYLQALLLLTARAAQRPRQRWRWKDADFQWRSLLLRDKVGGASARSCRRDRAALLAGLPRRRNRYVFSSPTAKAGRLTDPESRRQPGGAGRAGSAGGDVTRPGRAAVPGHWPSGSRLRWASLRRFRATSRRRSPRRRYRRRPLDLLRKWRAGIRGVGLGEQAGIEQPDGTQRRQPAGGG